MAVRTRLITPPKFGIFFSARSNPSSCRTTSTITRRGRSQSSISQTTVATEGMFRSGLLANQRHFCGNDFCTDATGVAHRGEMSEQTKPSHINSRANQTKLSQLNTDDVQLAHERDGFPH